MITKTMLATLISFATLSGFAKLLANVSDDELVSFVEKRIREWQPTAEERRFDEIGWVTNIRDAERLAAEHQRPLFYFTHDGRMAIGRC